MKPDAMKRLYSYTLCLVLLCLMTYALAPFVCAREGYSFTYESADKRDPFIPLVTKDGKLRITYGTLNSIDDVVLEGILYDADGGSIVVINDMVLNEGTRIGEIQVREINKDNVVLSFKGEDHTFKLKE